MRIAFSGSHRTGKSTLVEDLAAALPAYETVDEPYHSMVTEGHGFCHPPSREDFESQLERSIEDLRVGGEDVLFDRCPVDFLAYLGAQDAAGNRGLDGWMPRVRTAIDTLDLIVFVPIEALDRIAFSPSDGAGASRWAVDQELREILFGDPFDLGVRVLEVEGVPGSRVRTVLERIRGGSR